MLAWLLHRSTASVTFCCRREEDGQGASAAAQASGSGTLRAWKLRAAAQLAQAAEEEGEEGEEGEEESQEGVWEACAPGGPTHMELDEQRRLLRSLRC
jgi:hypothetical protein